MDSETNIVEVTMNNIAEHPQAICFINPKQEHYHKKVEWLKEQFDNGLKIKLLYLQGEKNQLQNYQNLTILYSRQCPWVPRFIEEVKPFLEQEQLNPTIIELKTAAQAQQAPSLYGVFNLIYNGKLLADRYISTTRFMNIVRKEIQA